MSDDQVGKRYSYLSHLECSRCGARYEADVQQGVASCGAPLLARYDLESLRSECSPGSFATRVGSLWRYHEMLPVRSPDMVVSLGEGMTPIIPLRRIGEAMEVPGLLMKDEGLLPTGTFKARGAAVGISRAKELGTRRIAMPTNGNAGAAWSAYAARAGMDALIVMPEDAPVITRAECLVTGAALYLVDGLIGDAGDIASTAAHQQGFTDVSTLKEPYRLEGKKTMGLEIFEQLGWRVPDVIVYPTGGGVGLIGMYKALKECQELGWLEPKLPRFVAVQAAGCAPIVEAWKKRQGASVPWKNASTIAFGITVPKAIGDFLILDAIYATGGCAVAVDDASILEAQSRVARAEGVFLCPEGAACFAAVGVLRKSDWLRGDEEVLVLNTGAGIKYPATVKADGIVLQVGGAVPACSGEGP